MPPIIKRFLGHLGVWEPFLRDGHCPSFRTASAWGGPELISNEFILDVHNTGWRLDRIRFDSMLAAEAKNRGVTPLPSKVRTARYDGEKWSVDCGEAGMHTARCVVEATGRSTLLARLAGMKPINHDRLVASAVFFEDSANPEAPGADAVLIESFRDGWWYTAATPGGHRVAALLTDTDIARRVRANRLDAWMGCLAETKHVRTIIGGSRPLAPPKLWPAGSRFLQGSVQPGLIAVGDAVSCFDPLSSQGIIKALRSSIFASYALADWLLRSDDSGFARYHALMQREFASYSVTLRDYYRQEQRWPDSPFWHRRHIGFEFRKS
ncbi:MAG: tryptophan 7-halogenase [Candidatus Methylumidiphilus sp.]